MGFFRAVAPALCPLSDEMTRGAGQDAHMGTRGWGTKEGRICGPGFRNSISSAGGAGQGPSQISWNPGREQLYFGQVRMGRRKACGLAPQESCGQLVSSKWRGWAKDDRKKKVCGHDFLRDFAC